MRKGILGTIVTIGAILILIAGLYFTGELPGIPSITSSPDTPEFQGSLVGSGGYYYRSDDGNRHLKSWSVPAGDNYIAISSGFYQLALRVNGSIVCWGSNGLFDQCDVPGESDFIAIAGGSEDGIALRTNGSIVCWGKRCSNEPQGNDFTAISTVDTLNLALRSNGTIVAWGNNRSGQEIVPGGNDFVAISAGEYNGLALRSNGTIVCWGAREYCDVPPGNDYVTISASRNSNLAIKSSGELIAWDPYIGWNHYVPPGNDYVAVSNSISGYHLALRADGTIVCWGETGTGVCNISSSINNIVVSSGSSQSLAITNPQAKEILAAAWQKTKARIKTPPGEEKEVISGKNRTPFYPVTYVTEVALPGVQHSVMTYCGKEPIPGFFIHDLVEDTKNVPGMYPYKEFTIKSPDEAIGEFKTHRLTVSSYYLHEHGPISTADAIIVTNISFGYTTKTSAGDLCLQPVYAFEGYVKKGDVSTSFSTDFVPATENLVAFDFMRER
jgi:hypothetical protein